MKDSTARLLSRFHTNIYRVTRGWVGKRLVNNDMLLLTTQGRSSGEPHTVPLLYLEDGTSLVVIASWGGRDYHPDWYLNLLADPSASVNVDGASLGVIARTATDHERATWWPQVLEAYGEYEVYQDRTERRIPVVFLDPIDRPSDSRSRF